MFRLTIDGSSYTTMFLQSQATVCLGMEYGSRKKKTHFYHLVTELNDSGVVVGSRKLRLWGDSVFNDTTSWSELYENYTFLNNSPCGKKV